MSKMSTEERNLKIRLKANALAALCLVATFSAVIAGLIVACGSHKSDGWIDPPVFASQNGQLSLVMVAKPLTLSLNTFRPTGWVYEVCNRQSAAQQDCPSGGSTVQPYGGVRLQVQAGDVLNIRLVNQLPPTPPDAEHLADMPEMLAQNPTNLHTHGMIVEPRQANSSDSTYGDYVYVLGYPSGQAPSMVMPGLDTTTAPVDYSINIPSNHPSGLFWFHPHVHGLSQNQVTAGLSGIITVGSPKDYLPKFAASPAEVRHLVLKDMQVRADGGVFTQGDPDFCAPSPDPEAGEPQREGFCPGAKFVDQDGDDGDYTGGRWFFTVSGQIYPKLQVNDSGELWRLVNASGSRTYVLQLRDDSTDAPLPFQVISLDGIALDGLGAPRSADTSRLDVVPCPGNSTSQSVVCSTSLRMMSSTRAEIWVPGAGPTTAATLVTTDFSTGLDGDEWPFVKLAHVSWSSKAASTSNALIQVSGAAAKLTQPGGVLAEATAKFPGVSKPLSLGLARAIALQGAKALTTTVRNVLGAATVAELNGLTAAERKEMKDKSTAASAPNCSALAPGHHRRIFFGIPTDNPDGFGLGYEEVDANGTPVPGTFQDIFPFDGSIITVCLPLAPGNQPATETWELINVTREDHNFHMHQTKFRVLSGADASIQLGAMMDSVPVPQGSDTCDASIATWRSGTCTAKPVTVSIPFSQIGDFVYHCHILEHEDGGMMAHIRVVPSP